MLGWFDEHLINSWFGVFSPVDGSFAYEQFINEEMQKFS